MRRGSHRKSQSGVSLLEAMLAILIFSVGILALVALQSVSVKATTESKFRADAGFLASQIIGQMWSDYRGLDLGEYVYNAGGADCGNFAGGGGNAAVAAWVAAVRDALPGATNSSIQIVRTSNPGPDYNRVAINICWQPPGADDWRRFSTVTQINM